MPTKCDAALRQRKTEVFPVADTLAGARKALRFDGAIKPAIASILKRIDFAARDTSLKIGNIKTIDLYWRRAAAKPRGRPHGTARSFTSAAGRFAT